MAVLPRAFGQAAPRTAGMLVAMSLQGLRAGRVGCDAIWRVEEGRCWTLCVGCSEEIGFVVVDDAAGPMAFIPTDGETKP